MTDVAAQWYADPQQRHEYRYWDGQRWTDQVSDHGVAMTDRGDTPVDPYRNLEVVNALGGRDPQNHSVYYRGTPISWGDVPGHTEYEARLVPGELPLIWSPAGLLATDVALLDKTDRYEFMDMANVDEHGFDHKGIHVKLKWKHRDPDLRFFWLLVKAHESLAPALVVQPNETEARIFLMELGCVLSAAPKTIAGISFPTGDQEYEVTRAIAKIPIVVSRNPAIFNKKKDDFYQFVTCPTCWQVLRLRYNSANVNGWSNTYGKGSTFYVVDDGPSDALPLRLNQHGVMNGDELTEASKL